MVYGAFVRCVVYILVLTIMGRLCDGYKLKLLTVRIAYVRGAVEGLLRCVFVYLLYY